MLEQLRQSSTSESAEHSTATDGKTDTESITQTLPFRLGRLAYGGILAFMAVDGIRNSEERAEYAAAKNVPMPEFATVASHWMLLIGGAGISLWRYPALAASAVVTFFLGVTPAMHDFWTLDDPDQKQQQLTHFLKNVGLLGTALVLLGVAEREDRH